MFLFWPCKGGVATDYNRNRIRPASQTNDAGETKACRLQPHGNENLTLRMK